mgnify:FL=1
MKKYLIMLTILLMVLIPKETSALESFIVMDSDSGRILGGSNIDEKYLIASTTKIMTIMVALETTPLTNIICAGDEIKEAYGSMIYIDQGECMTLYDLLVGLMLRSGNDAAVVIAANTIGYDNFINKMNELASKIGMKNTIFTNPHGLDEKTQNYSTAHDLGLLMAYATKNKMFMEITSIKKYTTTTSVETHLWYNKNKLLSQYKFSTSGKIGYTKASGHVFVSSATKGKENLVIASIKDDNQFVTHKNLYEKYFNEYDKYKIIDSYSFSVKDNYYKNYYLYVKEDVDIMLNKNELGKVNIKINIYKKKKIKDNDVVGNIEIYVNNKYIESINLYGVSKSSKIKKTKTLFSNIFS